MLLATPALALVNHVLASEDWARERLGAFAGKTVRVQWGGGAALLVRISADGCFEGAAADPGTPVAVSIGLPGDALVRLLTDPATLFSSATIAGSADLAETLGFVFRNLRWDIEHDLAQVVGDVAARRGLQLVAGLARGHLTAARKLALGLAEYLTEESTLISRQREVEVFCLQVDELRDDLARLEKRLGRIEARHARLVQP